MPFTLRQLRYLVALADEAHFGRAAAAVNISQPALSVQIRELEAALGVRLVERGGRELVITPTGREIVRRARPILAEVARDRAGRALGPRAGGTAAHRRDPDGRALPAALGAAAAAGAQPSLDLGIREAQTDRLIEEVRQGTLDAAVVALPVSGPDLVAAPLFEDRFLLAGSRGAPEALGAGSAPRCTRRTWRPGNCCCSTTATA